MSKKPTSKCKHADEIVSRKHRYSQGEFDSGEGCWRCGGPLTLVVSLPPRTLDRVSMSEDLRARCEADPELAKKVLALLDKPTYVCEPCWQGERASWALRKREDFIPHEQLWKELFSPEFKEARRKELLERISGVEACVPDCPYRDKIPGWKRRLEEEQLS